MKVAKIEKVKELFLKDLQSSKRSDQFVLRKAIKNWQSHFDVCSEELENILDISLETDVSGRLWEGSKYSYKSGLLMLAKHHIDLCQFTLKDLFNEDMSFDMRLNRYVFHCDQILTEIRKKDQKVNHHYQDYYFASLLTTLQYPNQYVPLKYDLLHNLFLYLEVLNIPHAEDIERIVKIYRNLYKVIYNDQEFMQKYMSFVPEDAFLGPSMSVVYEIAEFVNK